MKCLIWQKLFMFSQECLHTCPSWMNLPSTYLLIRPVGFVKIEEKNLNENQTFSKMALILWFSENRHGN